jgi:hypothetical protein
MKLSEAVVLLLGVVLTWIAVVFLVGGILYAFDDNIMDIRLHAKQTKELCEQSLPRDKQCVQVWVVEFEEK